MRLTYVAVTALALACIKPTSSATTASTAPSPSPVFKAILSRYVDGKARLVVENTTTRVSREISTAPEKYRGLINEKTPDCGDRSTIDDAISDMLKNQTVALPVTGPYDGSVEFVPFVATTSERYGVASASPVGFDAHASVAIVCVDYPRAPLFGDFRCFVLERKASEIWKVRCEGAIGFY